MATLPSTGRADKARELRSTIDQQVETLAKAVDAVRASADFKAYLDVQARFHRYSWCNTMLIYSQRPDASRVAGYKAWQGLKRQVRKGEHGIRIFAPCPFKRENAKTGETEAGIFFRCVSVFDVAQTDGEALPTVDVPDLDTAADDLLARLVRVAESRSIALTFKPIDGGTYGVSKKGAIDVDNTHTTGQQAKTLSHELAHEALHWEDKGTFTRTLPALNNVDDAAVWRRILVWPFAVSIPSEEQDPDLPRKLDGELTGILRWAVAGCNDWRDRGNRLNPPSAVTAASATYRGAVDTVHAWISAKCDREAGAKSLFGDLYRSYVDYCKDNDVGAVAETPFGLSLGRKGFSSNRTANARWRVGIRLKAVSDVSESANP